jgi:methionyl-tRNA synthetase
MKKDFIEQVTEQLYDAKADQFLADRFVGTCPKCGNEEAYGDQCEQCGSTLNATDLINPKSTITGETPL